MTFDGGANTLAAQNACSCVFSPVSPLFRGRTGRQIKTGRQQPYFAEKLVRLFSPRKPRFRRRCAPLKVSLWRRMSADATGIFILTGDNALLLTAFALAFSPVSPLSVAAFAALRVSFPGACPGKDGSLFCNFHMKGNTLLCPDIPNGRTSCTRRRKTTAHAPASLPR